MADGEGRCKIGAPTDYGLYFHFGSLVGWAGGANGDGRGQGKLPNPIIYVKPSDYKGSNSWPAGYFMSEEIGNADYVLPTKDVPSTGIGDPCRFYLGGKWRTPTAMEYVTLTSKGLKSTVNNGVTGHWFGPDTYKHEPVECVFFPVVGRRMPSNGLLDLGAAYYYWSSSFRAKVGYLMYYDGIKSVYPISGGEKSSGHPVRCVSPE